MSKLSVLCCHILCATDQIFPICPKDQEDLDLDDDYDVDDDPAESYGISQGYFRVVSMKTTLSELQ